MARTYLLWGPAGTGKTTFALDGATEQEPVWYAEMEPNGFRRAASRLRLNEGAVQVEKYPTPAGELDSLLGAMPLISSGGKVDIHYELEGWLELLNSIVHDMMKAVRSGKRPVFDTSTRFWLIVRNAFQEMCQKASSAEFEKLDQQKYTWGNKIHLQVHEFADAYGLDAVWVAHRDTVFRSDPPAYKPDSWKELPGMVDASLEFSIRGGVPTARIDKGAEAGINLQNLLIPEPTLKKLNAILDIAALLQNEDAEVSKDAEELLDLARMRGLL